MTTDKISESTKLTYDDRRKILHQKKSQVDKHIKDAVKDAEGKETEKEQLMSTVSHSMEVEYTEAGIRLSHKNLIARKAAEEDQVKGFEDKLLDQKKLLDQNPKKEMTKELKELEEKLIEISKYKGAEKVKADYDAIEDGLNAAKEELADTAKELKQLTDEIGTRLKF